jgi:hypothetical protein
MSGTDLFMREETKQMGIQRREAFVEGIDEATRTIRFRFSTGARRKTIDWNTWRYVNEELSLQSGHVRLDRLNKGAPFLKDHRASMDCQIGVHTGAWLEGGAGWGTARLFEDEESEKCFQKIRGGAKNISVGYRVHTYEVTEKDGELPLYRAVDWEPVENSLVAIPADADAQIRSAEADAAQPESSTQLYPVIIRSHSMNEVQLRLMNSLLTRLGTTEPEQAEKRLGQYIQIATAARAATGKDDASEVEGGLKALTEARTRAAALEAENKDLQGKLVALESQEHGRTYRELTETGQREGKLPPAMVTWARSICVREEKAADGSVKEVFLPDGLRTLRGFLDVAVPVGPGLVQRTEAKATETAPADAPLVLTPEEKEVCRNMGISEEKMIATKREQQKR